MIQPLLPKNVKRLEAGQVFSFLCHSGIDCFTHCCRQLELALTPYDVLRLKNAAGLSSSAFLEHYVIIEQDNNDIFPRFYLTMVDDGMESCVFVSKQGCTFYRDRPGACRAYPMGRAAVRTNQNTIEDFFILIQEPHCHGFTEDMAQTPAKYCQEQGLLPYNRFNDAVATILQHENVRQGMSFTAEQTEGFVLSLYNIDTFRDKILADQLPHIPLDDIQKQALKKDEAMLLFAIDWLRGFLFGQ
jgi:uncharacterized protein